MARTLRRGQRLSRSARTRCCPSPPRRTCLALQLWPGGQVRATSPALRADGTRLRAAGWMVTHVSLFTSRLQPHPGSVGSSLSLAFPTCPVDKSPASCAPGGGAVIEQLMLMLVALVQVLCVVPAAALTDFPSKFLVGEVNGQVVVTCDTAQEQVSWKQNEHQEIMAEHHIAGRTLTLEGLDQPAAGNYSCWHGPRLLDSTYVVVSDPDYPLLQGAPGSAVTCRAESYGGELSCSWTALRPAAFRARLSRSPPPRPLAGPHPPSSPGPAVPPHPAPPDLPLLCRSPDGAPGAWLYVGGGSALQGPDQPQPFTVTLADGTFCPFAEEPRPLELVLEGISAESFVNITHRLFLRDIVRPGPPQDVTAQSKGGLLHLSWAPPASWSSPHSYFLLRYQLEYEHWDGTKGSLQLEGVTEMSIEGDVRWVQIRCQDPLVNSTWSPWTTWQNV
ncbi:interleukin-12 subunit beta-like [Lepidochelys kempii]|uniref:interleukin-12 subunit beta-like n=1 Tax=Lepidochelys kempii TaxID=8472 RepID=UPI003C6FBE46